jgi:hypothetical protein
MTVKAFRSTNFKAESLKKIKTMQEIVAEYDAQDLRLTARQLYYQFVSRNIIPNTERSYKNLTGLLADARYAGMVDWQAIEDRGREPAVPLEFRNIRHRVDSALHNYRLQRWADQPNYCELWVEKQALAGVLEPLAHEFHVTLMVNKGYSSASAMFESAERFLERSQKDLYLYYLGDHDPSGEDMVRDIAARLEEFGVLNLNVQKIALTMDQVNEYDPPPNPAKTTDSRFAAYEAKHGNESWEVDALPPNVLQQLIRESLEGALDREAWDAVLAREETDKAKLRNAAEKI